MKGLLVFFATCVFESHALTYYAAVSSGDCSCSAEGGCCNIVPGGRGVPGSRAWGAFSDDVATDGWGKLYIHVEPSTQSLSDDGSYAAGFLEGFLTSQQISDHYLSWYDYQFGGGSPEENPPSQSLVDFMFTQYNWTMAQLTGNTTSSSRAHHVAMAK
jgi:hypothetical protein